jgi:hypothetical protein
LYVPTTRLFLAVGFLFGGSANDLTCCFVFAASQIPLAKKLKECRVFGVSCDEFLDYALDNRGEWESKGQEIVELLVEEAALRYGEHVRPETLVRQAQERRTSDKSGTAMPPEQAAPRTEGSDEELSTGRDEKGTVDGEFTAGRGEKEPDDHVSEGARPESAGKAEEVTADLASSPLQDPDGGEDPAGRGEDPAGRGENASQISSLVGGAAGGQNGAGPSSPKGKGSPLRTSKRNRLDGGARFI